MGSKLPKHREQRQMERFFRLLLEEIRLEIIVLCNLNKKDASQLKIKDPVLKEVVEHGSNLNYTEKNPVFESTCIWHNSLITIEKKPFFLQIMV